MGQPCHWAITGCADADDASSAEMPAPEPLRFRMSADVLGAPRRFPVDALGSSLAQAMTTGLRRALGTTDSLTVRALSSELFSSHYDPIAGGRGNVGVHLEIGWSLRTADCDRSSAAAVAARLRDYNGVSDGMPSRKESRRAQ